MDVDTVISLPTAMPRAQRHSALRTSPYRGKQRRRARDDHRRQSGGRRGLARSALRRSGHLQGRDPSQRHPPSISTSACAPDHDPGHGATSAPLSRHEGPTRCCHYAVALIASLITIFGRRPLIGISLVTLTLDRGSVRSRPLTRAGPCQYACLRYGMPKRVLSSKVPIRKYAVLVTRVRRSWV